MIANFHQKSECRCRPLKMLLAALFLWILTAAPHDTAAAREEIIASAAASLTQALQAVGRAYEARQGQVAVAFNFAASGALLQQLAHGAPVDVFLSADQAFMDRAAAKNLIRMPSRRNFARNTLVLALSRQAAANIQRLEDLTLPAVGRIAIGDPETVPAGRYARQALTAANVWDKITAKLILAASVRQVLDYLRRGEADAGLIYATDLRLAANSVRSGGPVPVRDPIAYCMAVTAGSRRERSANSLMEFILSPHGQDVLAGFGFQKIRGNPK